jgi:hypothetical protein
MFTIIGAVVYPINSPSPPLFIFETSTAQIGINNATYDTAATRSRRERMTLGFEPCLAMPTTDAPAVEDASDSSSTFQSRIGGTQQCNQLIGGSQVRL